MKLLERIVFVGFVFFGRGADFFVSAAVNVPSQVFDL